MKQNTTFEISELKRINNIINALYDIEVPLQNRLLHFINELHSIIYSDRTSVFFFYPEKNGACRVHSSISINFDTDKKMVKSDETFRKKTLATLPHIDSESTVLFSANSYFKKNEKKKKTFWSGYLLPTDNLYAIEGNVHIANEELRCGFILYRNKEGRDFEEKEVAIMSLLQPHLSNLLWYYGDEDDNTDFFFILENYDCVGMANFDENYKVTNCNDIYNDLLSMKVYDDKGKEKVDFIANTINEKCRTLAEELLPKEINDSLEFHIEGTPLFICLSINKVSELDKAKYSCIIYDLSDIYDEKAAKLESGDSITREELNILKGVLSGYSNEEVAAGGNISLHKVEKALTEIHRRLDEIDQE